MDISYFAWLVINLWTLKSFLLLVNVNNAAMYICFVNTYFQFFGYTPRCRWMSTMQVLYLTLCYIPIAIYEQVGNTKIKEEALPSQTSYFTVGN